MGKKVCTKCGSAKPVHGFSAKPNGKNGLQAVCRLCAKKFTADWRAGVRESDEKIQTRGRGVIKNPTGWRQEAVCAGSEHPDLWFPDEEGKPLMPGGRGEDAVVEWQTRLAKAECNKCPVWAECLSQALNNGERGVWGGTTWRERRIMLKREQTARLKQREKVAAAVPRSG